MVKRMFSQQYDPQMAAGTTTIKSPSPNAGRGMPSPVHMRADNRSVSPLTNNESAFGAGGRYYSTANGGEREQPSLSYEAPRNKGFELECDYDRSVTQLYEMLESSQWENARIRCNTHPEETHTWVVRRDVNGSIRWKLLPLHAAVIFKAPLSLIENLLTQNPIAAAKRDDQGILPLHLAFRHKADEAIIEKLLSQYPSGVLIKDQRERLPLDHGKDMRFSVKLMGLYAETFSKCQHNEAEISKKEAEITAAFEIRLKKLEEAYEARIDTLVKSYEETNEATKLKAEEDARKNRECHRQEIEKLESILAREMMADKRSPEVENELQGLSSSLADATRELMGLRKVVEEQKHEKEEFVDNLREMLKDQTTLHERCTKQQEQLENAEKLREQLLRNLLQKDDGNTIQVANDICQISDNNMARTEKLLSSVSLTRSRYAIEDHAEPSGILPSDNQYQNADDLASDTPNPSRTAAWQAEPEKDHGDDISAITENSYLQPFGDR